MKILATLALALTALLSGCVVAPYEDGRGYQVQRQTYPDRDRDGVPNRLDRDRDGDGIPNRVDRRPDNPRRY